MKSIKTMKKSMMLSTVLMVVLLIVALSTATFAWFSANNTVTATQAKMTAATSSDANISIGWATNPKLSSISFNDVAGMKPAIPKNAPNKAAGETIEAEYVASNNATCKKDFPIAQGYDNQATDYPVAVKSLKVVPKVTVPAGPTIAIPANDAALLVLLKIDGTNFGTVDNCEIIGGNPTDKVARYSTIYKTRNKVDAAYALQTAVQPAGTFTNVEGATAGLKKYEYLIVTADAGLAGTLNYVSVANAVAGTYDGGGKTELKDAVAGNLIYNMNVVKAQYTVVPLGQPAPATFIAGGIVTADITLGVDFATFLSSRAKADTVSEDPTVGFIPVDIAQGTTYGCAKAEVGDVVSCSKAKGTSSAATKIGDFVLEQNTVDNKERFRGNGVGAGYSPLKEKGGTASNFYIKNNSAAGSAAAKISLSADITVNTGDTKIAATDVRIAVFVKLPGGTDFNYFGTLAQGGGATSFGTIAIGAHSKDLKKYEASPTLTNMIALNAGEEAELQFVVWYEGTLLDAEKSGQAVNIAFDFKA